MNKTSVVIDRHTVSYWKYQLIDKLYKENNLNNNKIEGIIVGKSIYDGDIKLDELAKEISA